MGKADQIIQNVKNRQASENTMFHALYGFYFLGLKRSKLASIYGKSITTISNWIIRYENEGHVHRKKTIDMVYKKFGKEKRDWLVNLYKKQPILYLHESKRLFFMKFGISISASSVSVILKEAGLSWKCIERMARQIQMKDIVRFCQEMDELNWSWEQLVFIDEVSIDGREVLRKRGYGVKGSKLVYRGEFGRSKRVSLLCFIGVEGLLNAYETEGTFTRKKFVDNCKHFATETTSIVYEYPGPHSVWLMDGAAIHCSKDFVYFLRNLGLRIIFLPAYTPMYNPIELMFALVKKQLKYYPEHKKIDKNVFLCEVLNTFANRDFSQLFRKCGYMANGIFDASKGFNGDLHEIGYNRNDLNDE